MTNRWEAKSNVSAPWPHRSRSATRRALIGTRRLRWLTERGRHRCITTMDETLTGVPATWLPALVNRKIEFAEQSYMGAQPAYSPQDVVCTLRSIFFLH
jgi:hypothetical protein